jgi:LPS sulfotransferase NodH
MYSQLRKHPEILAYMAVRRVHVVHLIRVNHIDVIVSEELARLTGKSHVEAGTRTDVPLVYLNPETLIDRIQKLSSRPRKVRRMLQLSTCPRVEVTYEALVAGEQELARILRFLGISHPASHVKSSFEKRGTTRHREAIVNYDEVRQALRATPFLNMLR